MDVSVIAKGCLWRGSAVIVRENSRQNACFIRIRRIAPGIVIIVGGS
jgi:hypothetical protein